MGPGPQNHVQIAGRSAINPFLALAGQPDLGAIVHTGRDIERQTARFGDSLTSPTLSAGRSDHFALTLTARAGGDVNKNARLAAYLACAVTIGTADGRGAWLCSVAVTARAGLLARDLDLLLRAKDCFFKLYFQVVAQVGTPAWPSAGTSRSHAEAGPKELLEDFKGVPKAPKPSKPLKLWVPAWPKRS